MRTLCLVSAACLLAALFTPFLTAQAIVTQQWDYRTSGPYHGAYPSCGIGVDNAGNSYICGSFWRPGMDGRQIYITKFSPDGDTLWTSYYGSSGQDNIAADMVVDATGNLFMTGANQATTTGYDFITLKYNSEGQRLWAASYVGPIGDDQATAIAVDNGGNVYVTGNSTDANYFNDYATIKYSPQGEQMWVAHYSCSGQTDDRAVDLAVDEENNVYVTGVTSTYAWPNDNYNIATVKYNSLGQQQWVVSYDGPAHDTDTPTTLRLDAQANVYIAGSAMTSANNLDYLTLKYSSSGVQQWAALYGVQQANVESGTDLAVDTDGSVIVSGYSIGIGIITIKYNSVGAQQWQQIRGDSPDFYEQKVGLTLDENHNIYVAGTEGSSWINLECATYKYNAQGDLQWIAKYDPDDCCEAGFDVALDHHGNVFVTGEFWWPDYGDMHPLLIKYNQFPGSLTATMIPTVFPVVIPAQGGSFSYNLETFNTVRNNLATDFWWKLIYPAPSTTTVSLGPITMALPLDSASVLRTQRIPGNLPSGIYHYAIYAGDYPNMVWATDTIQFTKLATGNGPVIEDDWSLAAGVQAPLREGGDKLAGIVSNSPNPFNPTTALSFKLQAPSHVSLKVYDTTGRLVTTLVDGGREAGTHEVTFDGSKLASGIYVYRLEASGSGTTSTTMTGKMVLMK